MLVGRIQWHIMPKLQTRGVQEGTSGLHTRLISRSNLLESSLTPSANSGTSVHTVRGRQRPDVFGRSASALEAETNRAHYVRTGAIRDKLSLHHRKLTRWCLPKLKFDVRSYMGNRNCCLVDEIRLLGLIIDKADLHAHVAKAADSHVDFRELPYPAHVPEFGFESVEDLDPSTVERLAIVGPHIYADGSKIEGRMFALHRAIRGQERQGSAGQHLQRLKVVAANVDRSKTYNPLAHAARQDIRDIVAEGREVHLFWVRAHADTAGNERADEARQNAALKGKTAADYDRFPLSYAKSGGAASLDEWQL
ncbi:hypothetical protein EVAR_94583_1 [Eumeta japonica]|uniref:RNase H type-1 domain-containing protein n=1 Tax=Eumeta variegata TaxID=151549 RepID=A0A4C1UTI9_EUMVA|nr:hypothetical protein EVAR_94583_1 [Eumeta japonica]